MFEWLPEVCRELRGNLIEIYWLLLVPFSVFLLCLEFFKIPDSQASGGRILKRVVISMLLLFSFEQCMNIIAMISDGITEKVNGITQLKDLLHQLEKNYTSTEVSWVHFREAVIYLISLLSYIVAYLGVFTADVLIHFVWAVLYVTSPLMILMYVSDKTAFVTESLYRGLINVVTWKVLWGILGVMLLKMATTPVMATSDNFLTAVLMNLCIGISMLFIPFATKSLIGNGFESAASALATVPTAAAGAAIKLYTLKFGKKALTEPFTGFKGTRKFAAKNYDRAKNAVAFGKNVAQGTHNHTQKVIHKLRSHGELKNPVQTKYSPFDPKGPFGKGKQKFFEGKE